MKREKEGGMRKRGGYHHLRNPLRRMAYILRLFSCARLHIH